MIRFLKFLWYVWVLGHRTKELIIFIKKAIQNQITKNGSEIFLSNFRFDWKYKKKGYGFVVVFVEYADLYHDRIESVERVILHKLTP